MNLTNVSLNQTVYIEDILGTPKVKRRLLDMGLTKNTAVKVLGHAPFGDPLKISVRGYTLSMRKEEATKIKVREKQ